MQLSRFTDYSLRVLLFVATNNNRRCHLTEIAEFYQISTEHLRKVVHALSKSGHLKTYRGKNGGITLGLLPNDINIGDIVEQSESDQPIINCATPVCILAGHCTLQPVILEAKQAFMDVLRRYTLADLLSNSELKRHLIHRQEE